MEANIQTGAASAGKKRVVLLALVLLTAVVVVNLILPLVMLFVKAVDFEPFWEGFASAFSKQSTLTALANSAKVTACAATFAVGFAYFFAYIVEFKLKGRMKRAFRLISILPMLVPSITHGIVIVYLFGNMGIFTRLTGLNLNIYGPLGIIMGSFFYSFPMAFLVFSQAFVNLDGRLFDNTRVLGVAPLRRFFDITLPMTKYAIFSAYAVCFTMIFTDYGIPLSVGGTYQILPILFYRNVVGLLDFSTGAIYSIMLLVPAAIVYLLDVFWFSKKQASTRRTTLLDTGRFAAWQKGLFALITFVIFLCIAVIVLVPFVENWPYDLSLTTRYFELITRNGRLARLILNSLVIALCTGVIGTLLSFGAGYIYVRDKSGNSGFKKLTHGLYMVTLAVPGLALGLAFALTFRGSFLYNTLAILIIVNVMHFFGSPYMMVISHFKLMDPNLEDVCRSLGASPLRTLTDVIIPSSKKVLTDVFAYFFTNTMVTISAVSMLYNSRTMTLAVQITAFSNQGSWESAVSVALVILLTNTAVKIWQNRRLDRR
ncbi:MAG: ABC transporter permease subunit [Oscillospiraceae bacterium]|nr:ABC transporter permease subunit [Oscillospiraceae bacterium]